MTESADPSASWRVTWRAAGPEGVTVRIYAVTSCLHTPTPSMTDVTCMVDGDTIPQSDLLFLGSVPASAGMFSFTVGPGASYGFGSLPVYGPTVYAVVVQAVNAQGGSLFAIAASSGLCYGCVV